MSNIYILGENSFLGKNIYFALKKKGYTIFLFNHDNICSIAEITDNDIIINCCGVNRASNYDSYEEGNYLFIKKILSLISCRPYFIHLSSAMVYGFKNKKIEDLSNYQKWFIDTKLKGEQYLIDNYDEDKLCILRPSNIFGYSCEPYYNNLLSTIVYEKINGCQKINNINKNCYRNMLSIEGFTQKVIEIVEIKRHGLFNIISTNSLSLEVLLNNVYDNLIPSHIQINDFELDCLDFDDSKNNEKNIIIEEDIFHVVKQLECKMRNYLVFKEMILIRKLEKLVQSRGEMVEISSLVSKRTYKITLTPNSVRGNHYHEQQIEEFYMNKGYVLFILAHKDNPNIPYLIKLRENELIQIKPTIIHTLTNDYKNNEPDIIINSTQEHIKNQTPDTIYINII